MREKKLASPTKAERGIELEVSDKSEQSERQRDLTPAAQNY